MSKSQQLARVPYTTLFRSEAPLEVTATVNNHDQGPVNLDWGEGDPVEVEDGEDATHTYEEAGEHTITATDTDDDSRTATVTITVTEPEPEPEDLEMTVDRSEERRARRKSD